MQIKKLLLPILATVMLICGCQQNNAVSGQDQLVTASENKTTYTAQNIPEYTGSPYVELNNNIPDFQESEYTTEVFEQYSDLDALVQIIEFYPDTIHQFLRKLSCDLAALHVLLIIRIHVLVKSSR